jgi:alpha-L-fucosidase
MNARITKAFLFRLALVCAALAALVMFVFPLSASAAGPYEAESAALSGGAAVATDHTGYSGTGFVAGYYSGTGQKTSFTVNVATAGSYNVTLRYANSLGSAQTESIYVNGTKVATPSYPNLANWDTWADSTTALTLNAGNNTIAYQKDSGNGCINLDYITVQSGTGPTPTKTNTPVGPPPTRTATPGPTATPGSFPVAGTYYQFTNRNSGKVVEVASNSTADGGNVQQWAWVGGNSQQWSFVALTGGYYEIINRNSGKVLEVAANSTADGGNVQQWAWVGTNSQQWTLTAVTGGYYKLINRNSGKALDVVGNGTADGVNIDQWTDNGGNNQQWTITVAGAVSPTATPGGAVDIWNLPTFPVATGTYTADWTALGLSYSTPQWWRDAKFGAWAHWDPQSMPEQGDWYAYRMYQVGSADYNYHLAHFGDPSVYGYKDIAHNWVIDQWDPNALMDIYVQMGAKFFMAMGSHHDNFDNFNSTYQPWNSVRVGPQKDIVGTWAPIARQKGLRFGIGFHNTPARTWGQWMPVRYSTPAHSDALQTTANGTGKWWQGMNPADLYGPQHTTDCANNSCNNSAYGTQFMYRVDDAINKYHPDVVYFDDHAGDSQMDLGVHMGLGSIATKILANYYNKSLTWNQGKMDVVMNMKGVGGQYNSFQNSPSLEPYAERGLVRSTEAATESQISAYPFQTELDIQGGNWHYMTGAGYTGAASLVTTLMQNVSRNGSLLLNLTQHGRGNLDTQCIQIAHDIGTWLGVNGEAVYASRPFEVWGDSTVIYTRHNGYVYATLLNWNGGAVTLSALKSGGATLGTVSKVELLGSTVAMTFSQSGSGLTVTPGGSVSALSGISDSQLASKMRVLKITHNKGRFNDDDPGATYPGWLRKSNLGTGDYNNDLTTSTTTGNTWTSTFTGTSVSVYAPKESGAGSIEIQVDGQIRATVALSTTGARLPQQMVAQVTGLASGQHTISIINRGPGPVAVDAIVAQ